MLNPFRLERMSGNIRSVETANHSNHYFYMTSSPKNIPEYTWTSDWAQILVADGFAHHGITVLDDGNILSGHADRNHCLVFSPAGELLREFEVPVQQTHGLLAVMEEGREVLWVTDPSEGVIVKCGLNGTELAKLKRKDFPLTADNDFKPTATAVNPMNGNVWVTDGYGSNTVHCFDRELRHLFMLEGSDELGEFREPHWIFADMRSGTPRFYVADRGNDQVQVFHPDGTFSHGITEGLVTPSVFDSFEDYLVIGELKARVVLCDREDRILSSFGEGGHHVTKPGWPNRLIEGGAEPVSPLDDIPEGEFNSPHGVCCDPKGNIYVSEWLIGDRFTKLERIV